MTPFGFQPDKKILDLILADRFTISAEVIPPRNGTEQTVILDQIRRLIHAGAEFLSVTKGAGGSLRGGSLPIAQVIKEQFRVPVIAHFTCRDLTPHEVENQLVDHHYFGIRNILALRGDPPTGQASWVPKEGSYPYAHQLISQIALMNRGKLMSREGSHGLENTEATDFCIGCAVYPEHPDPTERTDFFKSKIDAGAAYGITQMLFDIDAYSRFLEETEKAGLKAPVVPGTRILRSQKQARTMATRFGVSVPESLIAKLPAETGPESLSQCVDVFMSFIDQLKKAGAPGVHLFVLSDTTSAERMLQDLRRR